MGTIQAEFMGPLSHLNARVHVLRHSKLRQERNEIHRWLYDVAAVSEWTSPASAHSSF